MSWRAYFFSKRMKRRSCWCFKPKAFFLFQCICAEHVSVNALLALCRSIIKTKFITGFILPNSLLFSVSGCHTPIVNHFWGWDFTRTAFAHGNAARFGLAGEGLKRSLILFYQNVGWEKKVTSPWYKDVLMFDCLFVGINYYTGFNLHGTLNSLESVHLPWTGNISSIKRESKNIINYLVFSPMSNNKNFLLISSHTKNKTNVISFFSIKAC